VKHLQIFPLLIFRSVCREVVGGSARERRCRDVFGRGDRACWNEPGLEWLTVSTASAEQAGWGRASSSGGCKLGRIKVAFCLCHSPQHPQQAKENRTWNRVWSLIVAFGLTFFTSHSDNKLMTLFTPHPCSDTTFPSAKVLEASSPCLVDSREAPTHTSSLTSRL
jgi:hypothetical protein